MLELWLIRHGETDWNKERRWQGQTDLPLNDAGLAQTRRLAQRLRGRQFDQVYASDLDRARRTAELVLPDHDVRIDRRLREMNFGSLEGRSWENLQHDEQERLQRWWTDPYHLRLDDTAESFSDVERRLLTWQAELPSSGCVAAFTHGGPIRCLLYKLFGHPTDRRWTVVLDNTSITRLSLSGNGHTGILTINDTAHLELLVEPDTAPRP